MGFLGQIALHNIKNYELDDFKLKEIVKVEDKINLSCNEDILNLFSMTPYYYKTSEKDQNKLLLLNSLETEIAFEILVYTKK